MGFSVGKRGADSGDKNRAVFPAGFKLPFPGREPGIAVQQLLTVNKGYLLRQTVGELFILMADVLFGTADYVVNFANNFLQKSPVPLLRKNVQFPVPMVNLEGVGIVGVLVGAYGVHVGV